MRTDLDDRQFTPDADENDPYNRELGAFSDEDREAFGGELGDDNFNQEGTSGDLNGGAASPEQLRNAEGNTDESRPLRKSDPVNPTDDDEDGGLFSGNAEDGAQGTRGLRNRLTPIGWSRRRKGVVGGIMGLAIGGGVFFGFGVATGPLQVIHLGQVLHTSFSKNEFDTSNRSRRLFSYSRRFARAGGNGSIGETRVGLLGSKVFGSTIDQLHDLGIDIETGKAGQPTRTTIDTDKLKSKFPQLEGLSDEAQKAFIADKLSLSADSVKGSGTSFSIDQSDMNMKSSRLLAGSTVGLLDNGKIGTSIKTRVATKYWDLPSLFHFFDRAKAAVTKKTVNGKPQTEEQAQESQAETDEAAAEEKATTSASEGGATTETEDAKSKLGGKVSKALTIDGYACATKEIVDDIPKIDRARVFLPAAVDMWRIEAAASQNQSGQDISLAADAALVKTFTGKDGSTVWQSLPLQSLAGGDTSGLKDLDPGQKQAFGSHKTVALIDQSINDVLGGKKVADVRCNKAVLLAEGAGVVLVAGAEVVGSGGTAAPLVAAEFVAKQGLQYEGTKYAMKLITNIIVDKAAADALQPGAFSGSNGGGLLAYGSKAAASIIGIGTGGIDLGATTSASLDKQQQLASRKQFESESMFARMFDITDYRSLTGRLADAISPSTGTNLAHMASGFMHIGSTLSDTLTSLNPVASADGNSGYKFAMDQYGLPDELLNDPNLSNPYDNADKLAAILDTGSDSGSLIDKAKTCFGVTVAKGSDGLWDSMPITGSTVDPQSDDYLNAGCNDLSDQDWRRMIMFVFDDNTMKSDACYEGDAQSCSDLGAVTSNSTNSDAQTTFTVASYNMCNDAQHSDCQRPAEKVPKIAGVIEGKSSFYDSPSDIIGAQEVSPETQSGLLKQLSGYQSFPAQVPSAQGRAIFWNTARFNMVGSGRLAGIYSNDTSYVSKTTDEKAFPWVELQPVQGGPDIYVLSIHNPSIDRPNSAGMRGKNAKAILAWTKQYDTGSNVVVVTGDFNRSGNSLDGANNSYCIMTSDGSMQHAYDMSHTPSDTSKCPTSDSADIPIDQIYGSTNAGMTATNWVRVKDPASGTDHSPAFITYTIPGAANSNIGSTNYKNPIINQQSAGESVIRDGSTFHLYATGNGKIQHYTSSDAVNWKGQPSQTIQNAPASTTVQMWKPSITKVNDMYVMSWAGSAGTSGTGGFTIFYATGTNAGGPFTYGGQLVPKAATGNNIDPQIFTDDDGQFYLFFTNGHGGGLKGAKLNVSGNTLSLAGTPQTLVSFDASYGDDWTIEAPYVMKKNGQYLLYFSTGDYQAASRSTDPQWHGKRSDYMMHVARSSSPLGPYIRKTTNGKPDDQVVANNAAWVGVGTTTMFSDDAGQDWMIYAGRYPTGTTDRVSLMDRVTYDSSGWPIVNGGQGGSNTTMPGPALSGLGGSSTTGQGGQNSITDTYGPACTGKGGSTYGVACSGECVDYIEYLLNKTYNSPGKFGSFVTGTNTVPALIARYGMKSDPSAEVGDVVSWPANTGHNHVAAVIKVNSDGSIIVAEYNWSNNGPITLHDGDGGHSFDTRLVSASDAKQLVYAHANLNFN